MVKFFRYLAPVAAFAVLVPGSILAQEEPAQDPAATEQAADRPEGEAIEEVIVVTASRTEQRLQEVPVAMTVIGAEQLATTPADNYGDVLRSVPGLNVSQISARDIQISGRGATSSLATDQLVLLDGRTVYLDFFGFVMWDLLPVDFREIAQIEVVRGAGSAVWGANAMGGVINLITKSPWELQGTNAQLGGGEKGTLFASVTHARASEETGFKISASYFEQDPFDRPTGVIPGNTTTYPNFRNSGTKQPKVDLRLDRNLGDGSDQIVSFSLGSAGTDGIVHSGIGPFDIASSSRLDYGKVSWSKGALNVNFFANLLDGEATNLLTVGIDGRPLLFEFKSQTYNIDLVDSRSFGINRVTYGGNARLVEYDLSIARSDDNRQEYGLFLQDEIEFSEQWKWLVGARFDDIDPIGSVVSPRTSLLFSPSPNHNFRLSYNKAFRAPSLVENYLDTAIVNLVNLPTGPYVFPTASLGNPELTEEKQTSYEIGYVGSFNNKTTFTLAVYRNEREDETDFYAAAYYTAANPPPGWPLPPIFLNFPPLAGALPAMFTYRNIGEKINKGVEVSLDVRPTTSWRVNFNYSYQDEPEVTGIDPDEINLPPSNRFNASIAYDSDKFFADTAINYVDEAFWTDVLDARFWGTTDEYTSFNLTVGYRFNDNVTLSVIGNNITDERIQQHVFGDIISRRITGNLKFAF